MDASFASGSDLLKDRPLGRPRRGALHASLTKPEPEAPMSSRTFKADEHSKDASLSRMAALGAQVRAAINTLLAGALALAAWATTASAEPPKSTPRAHELAAELVGILKLQTAFSIVIDDRAINSLTESSLRSLPDGAVPKPVMQAAVREHVRQMGDKLAAGLADIYAARFTEDQLSEIVAFYRSSAGQAMVDQTSSMRADGLQLAQQATDDFQVDIIADVCAKVECHIRPTPGEPKRALATFGGIPWEYPSPARPMVAPTAPKSIQPNDAVVAEFRCRVGKQGRMEDCLIDWSSQGGADSERLALAALGQSRLKTRLLDGTDPEGLFGLGRIYLFGDGRVQLQLHEISATQLAAIVQPKPVPDDRNPKPATP